MGKSRDASEEPAKDHYVWSLNGEGGHAAT